MTTTPIPDGWIETTLGKATEVIDGDRGKNYPNGNDFSSSGYCLYLNTKNVPDTNFSFSEKMFITKEKDEILRKGKLQRNDFVLTTRGTIGNYAYYKDSIPFQNIRINSGMVIVRVDQDLDFFYYYLGSRQFKYQVLSLQSGSAQPQLPIRDLKTFTILLPPLPQQKAIASILSSFDDKIELLREQNATLEKTAQTIFHEWFGKYSVDNPEELPDGWRVGKVIDFGNIVCGKTPSKNNEENFGNDTPFIKIPDMRNQIFIQKTQDELSNVGASTQTNKFIPSNSICVSCIATVGLVSITTRNSQTNQQINSIILGQNTYLEYLYFSLVKMKQYLLDIGSGGTATLNINTKTFSNIEIILPASGDLEKFSQTTKPLFEKIKNNSEQIQTLSKTRDTLLPKLMSGKVRIN